MMWRAVAASAAQYSEWAVAIAWCARAYATLRGMPQVADLSAPEWEPHADEAHALPSLTVIVPALNEGPNIRATLETLRDQRLPGLQVIAVDDRSTDDTGAIMDEFAAAHPERFRVIHVRQLPHGWLGKTHALQLGVQAATSEYVLFIDGDILFAPSVLARVMRYVARERADHAIVPPTVQLRGWGEGALIGFIVLLGAWALRPWKVADPAAKRDCVGVGSFNLLRVSALAQIGGLAPQRLAVLEDLVLGRRVKNAGLRQRMAFAPGLILVRWAEGVRGLVGVMTKNLFSAVNFSVLFAAGMCGFVMLMFALPVAGLFWWRTLLPALLFGFSVLSVAGSYAPYTQVPKKYVWAMPWGAVLMVWAVARSAWTVLRDGGVRWRGTFYPLRELRAQNNQFRWMKENVVVPPPVQPL